MLLSENLPTSTGMGIYLDFQATTPLDAEVLEAMLPWLNQPANAHAIEHAWGRNAEAAVERAREQVAAAVNGHPNGVIFTASATEAANIVLRSYGTSAKTLVIGAIEHPSVDETAEACAQGGARVRRISVDRDGLLDLDEFANGLDDAALVSIMAVNNEVGAIQPIADVAALCRSVSVPFHTDAAQALGRIDLDMASGLSFATLSSHKIYGPPGIGAICAAPERVSELRPLQTGGGQQGGIRPGTVPVALCVGFGKACEIAVERRQEDWAKAAQLSAMFLEQLSSAGLTFTINGSTEARVPHNLNISFPSVLADELLARLPDLGLSTGSACSSGAIAPSRVLTRMGVAEDDIRGAVRVGFGRTTTEDEIIHAAVRIGDTVKTLRGV